MSAQVLGRRTQRHVLGPEDNATLQAHKYVPCVFVGLWLHPPTIPANIQGRLHDRPTYLCLIKTLPATAMFSKLVSAALAVALLVGSGYATTGEGLSV